jgi:hypothetical protein
MRRIPEIGGRRAKTDRCHGVREIVPAQMKSVKGDPQVRPCMNLILQAYENSPMVIDASGWAVLLASLLITVGWLWYLYR